MVKLKSNIFSIIILWWVCGWYIQPLFAQMTENKQFEIVVIIDGDLCTNMSLCALKNGISKEIKIMKKNLGNIVISEDDFSELMKSDSIKVRCRFSSKKDLMAKYLTFSIDKYFYDKDSGPLVNIYTLDDDRNKRMFKGLKRKYLYYIVSQIIIQNFNRPLNEIQFREIKY
jgi:hypothetical protein